MSLATTASVVGIAAGVNSLSGGSLFGGGAQGPSYSQAQQQATSPWFTGGGASQAAGQLQNLISNPSSILSSPLYQSYSNQSLTAMDRLMRAQGKGASGEEMASLANLEQSNALGFYNQQVGLLGSLAGVGFNPASGVNAGLGAAQFGAQQQQAGFQGLAQGLGGLSNSISGLAGLFGGGSPNYSPSGTYDPGYYGVTASGGSYGPI